MKDVEKIKEELYAFGKKYNACEKGLKVIKGNTLIELFTNIFIYISWCKETFEKTKEFNNIFNNELVIEDDVLLCDCTGLKSINIPNSVTLISTCAFEHCIRLTSINIPNSITSIGNDAFSNCIKFTSIEIPNSVTTIGEFAFAFCRRLKTITIPNSVTSIGDYAFYGCNKNLKIN